MAQRRKNARLITIEGECKPLEEWAQEAGISKQLIRYRLKRGKSPFNAVFASPRKYQSARETHEEDPVGSGEAETTGIPGTEGGVEGVFQEAGGTEEGRDAATTGLEGSGAVF